ncbi:LysR family transcriptional regulator [Vibrio sinensis]|uniref:LysR family transcriptional regulator n=1 Tax=Vibrio sinensis TaxID=2302434 RepID=A0A3A6QT01_9VIBR|nr:LysR family transcriptional regulator [Vibrio sinensis]RJX73736.1 LysR family transcriptional regulator [Vibrio sinensis]
MFSFEQLEAFTATVETGSFSAAARKLNKVQSAVSQHIINLEIDCGVELFDRNGRYPKLNKNGQKLLPYAQATLKQHKRLVNNAAILFQDNQHDITLAIDEGIPVQHLTTALASVCERFPTVSFECLSASSIDIIPLVTSKRATMGIMFSEPQIDPQIDFESLGSVAFDVYVSSQHLLALNKAPHLDILLLHRQLVIRSKSHETSSFQQAYSPDVWYADSHYVLLELMINGFGWGMLPVHIAQPSIDDGTIVRVPVEFEKLTWQANIDVIQHQSLTHCPAHAFLRENLRQLYS